MNAAIRSRVARRAGNRCEYCHLRQEDSFYSLHVEHIVPKQHGGGDSLDNLALSCRRCNLYKGLNLTSIDPNTGSVVPLFDPRHDQWEQHFRTERTLIMGKTPVGRATVRLLRMNDGPRRELRSELTPPD
jgi:hypothetical protein